jgi:ribosomal subunit interface protein
MRITTMKGTNMQLTDAIKSRVESKSQILAKLTKGFDPVADLKVEVGKTSKRHSKGPYYRAEFQLSVPGKELRAESTETDLYHAIDRACMQVRRQLKGLKDKRQEAGKKKARPGKE